VVLVTQRIADDALYLGLACDEERLVRHGIAELHRIGDCVAPRLLAEATFEGHRLGRRLGAAPAAV
jgi:dimethylamine/trimethylamine dehydrogenase